MQSRGFHGGVFDLLAGVGNFFADVDAAFAVELVAVLAVVVVAAVIVVFAAIVTGLYKTTTKKLQ